LTHPTTRAAERPCSLGAVALAFCLSSDRRSPLAKLSRPAVFSAMRQQICSLSLSCFDPLAATTDAQHAARCDQTLNFGLRKVNVFSIHITDTCDIDHIVSFKFDQFGPAEGAK
jgi:hypothetical protein